jgi:uncharacterized protein (TIGR02246 family)
MRRILTLLLLLVVVVPAQAVAGAAEDANALVDRWAATYSANDPDAVLQLYTDDAVFLGTVSPIIADNAEGRRAYFARLAGTGNKSSIAERRTLVISDTAVLVTGFYDFTLMQDGKAVASLARFTMLLVKRGDGWRIAHHHSSARPKPRS